jgi:hypothetical protein
MKIVLKVLFLTLLVTVNAQIESASAGRQQARRM